MKSIVTFIANLLSQMVGTVLESLAHNWMVLAFAIVTAVMLKTYVNTERLNQFMLGKTKVSIFASVLIGTFTPFCACGTTAVIIGMLTTTLPWGPIMAFLTSSPLMSPDGFVMISGVLSLRFAMALTLSSLVIGIASGFITHLIERRTGFLKDQTRYAGIVQADTCSCSSSEKLKPTGPVTKSPCSCSISPVSESSTIGNCCPVDSATGLTVTEDVAAEQGTLCCAAQSPGQKVNFKGFAEKIKWHDLVNNFITLGLKQILLYFSIFVGIGFIVNYFVPQSIISALFGAHNITAVPLAAIIGLPLYLTTESGIPIIQSMLKSGASEGAMLAFIITGSANSAWVIAGLSTFMKKRVITLYILFILLGGIFFGYIYDLALMFFR